MDKARVCCGRCAGGMADWVVARCRGLGHACGRREAAAAAAKAKKKSRAAAAAGGGGADFDLRAAIKLEDVRAIKEEVMKGKVLHFVVVHKRYIELHVLYRALEAVYTLHRIQFNPCDLNQDIRRA